MKSKFVIFILSIICIFAFPTNTFALTDSGIGTTINGVPVQYNETSGYPFINSDNRTLVPLRAAMEAYGCTVSWIQETQTAVVSLDNVTVNVPIGHNCIYVNGVRQETDTQATVLEGRIFLPIRAVLEAFGAQVGFDFDTNCVTVTKKIDSSQNDSGQTSQKNLLSSEEISALCSDSVFCIEVYGFNGSLRALGSGFFISSDGLAFTNFHVVTNSSYLVIHTPDGKTYDKVDIIDFYEEKDIALLKIHGDSFPYIELGDSDRITQGQQVYAIGSPLGLDNTMSEGIIANKSRIIDNNSYIQISVPINHGSSGGVLLNEYGEAIGITSSGLGESDLNFAIPINNAKELNRSLSEPHYLWEKLTYSYTLQTLDFESFSGVALYDVEYSSFGSVYIYDTTKFYACGEKTATDNYNNTISLYIEAMEEQGFKQSKNLPTSSEKEIIAILELADETTILYKQYTDNNKELIGIDIQRTPQYYVNYETIVDFGWFCGIPVFSTDSNEIPHTYKYKWSDYYSALEFLLFYYYDYLSILEEAGFSEISSTDDISIYNGNNLSISIAYEDEYFTISVKDLEYLYNAEQIEKNFSSAVFHMQSYAKDSYSPVDYGNGFFISADGLAITSFDMLCNSDRAIAQPDDGRVYDVTHVLHLDPENDLAIIRISQTSQDGVYQDAFPYLTLGDSDNIINTKAFGLDRLTSGQIMLSEFEITNTENNLFILTPGATFTSQGNPVLDTNGNVIGIIKSSDRYGDHEYAIPINFIKGYDLSIEGTKYASENKLRNSASIQPTTSYIEIASGDTYILNITYETAYTFYSKYCYMTNDEIATYTLIDEDENSCSIAITGLKDGITFLELHTDCYDSRDTYITICVDSGTYYTYGTNTDVPSFTVHADAPVYRHDVLSTNREAYFYDTDYIEPYTTITYQMLLRAVGFEYSHSLEKYEQTSIVYINESCIQVELGIYTFNSKKYFYVMITV